MNLNSRCTQSNQENHPEKYKKKKKKKKTKSISNRWMLLDNAEILEEKASVKQGFVRFYPLESVKQRPGVEFWDSAVVFKTLGWRNWGRSNLFKTPIISFISNWMGRSSIWVGLLSVGPLRAVVVEWALNLWSTKTWLG